MKKIKCYQCSSSKNSCSGFEEDSKHEINYVDYGSTFCFTSWKYNGSNWTVTERGCADLAKKGNDDVKIIRRQHNYPTSELIKYIEDGYQITSQEVLDQFMNGESCEDPSLVRSINKAEGECRCRFNSCNSKISTEQHGIITRKSRTNKRNRLTCYECFDNSCSQFKEKARYKIDCGPHSVFCFMILDFDGTTWAVKERGCAGLMRKNKSLTVIPHRRYKNWKEELENLKKQGYQGVTQEVIDDYGASRTCSRNESLSEIGICSCNSDLCNGAINKKPRMKCYECSNDPGKNQLGSILPCSGFQRNSSYEIDCENDNSRFCSTTMEFDGFHWTVGERSCAGLMIVNNRITIVPNRRGENLSRYKFVSRGVMDLYGDAQFCGRMKSSLSKGFNHACNSELCNAEIPTGYLL